MQYIFFGGRAIPGGLGGSTEFMRLKNLMSHKTTTTRHADGMIKLTQSINKLSYCMRNRSFHQHHILSTKVLPLC